MLLLAKYTRHAGGAHSIFFNTCSIFVFMRRCLPATGTGRCLSDRAGSKDVQLIACENLQTDSCPSLWAQNTSPSMQRAKLAISTKLRSAWRLAQPLMPESISRSVACFVCRRMPNASMNWIHRCGTHSAGWIDLGLGSNRIDDGCVSNAQSDKSPLYLAVENDHQDLVQFLLNVPTRRALSRHGFGPMERCNLSPSAPPRGILGKSPVPSASNFPIPSHRKELPLGSFGDCRAKRADVNQPCTVSRHIGAHVRTRP